MGVGVQDGLQKWAWPQGQRRFSPWLGVLNSSKTKLCLRGGGWAGVFQISADRILIVEVFERRSLGTEPW